MDFFSPGFSKPDYSITQREPPTMFVKSHTLNISVPFVKEF